MEINGGKGNNKNQANTFLITISILIAVGLVVILAVSIPSILDNPKPHFGFVQLKTVESLAGENLVESNILNSTGSGGYLVKEETVYFNNTYGGAIVINITQTTTDEFAINYVNSQVESAKYLDFSFENNTYLGFHYSYSTKSILGIYFGVAVGYDGNFTFTIVDVGIIFPNFNQLVQDQINAMT